jgi:hypothetical protein
MNSRRGFLLFTAVVLLPVALSYGVDPARSLGLLFDVSVSNVNGTHMFRAIMGLYLAMAAFWVAGALHVQLRHAALWSVLVFMLGLAAGRALSLAIDGMPHWLMLGYLLVELVLGGAAWRLLKRPD